jgi:hypothetical protein
MYTFVHLSAVTRTFAVFCLSTFYTRPRHFIPSNVEVRYTTLDQWIRIIESVFINSGRLNSLVFSQYSRGTPRLLIDYYFFGLKTNLWDCFCYLERSTITRLPSHTVTQSRPDLFQHHDHHQPTLSQHGVTFICHFTKYLHSVAKVRALFTHNN